MTSQFPAPPPDATRMLLILDGPMGLDDLGSLDLLVASYAPALVLGGPDTALAQRLGARVGAKLGVDVHLGSEDGALVAVRATVEAHAGSCLAVVADEPALRVLLCEALGVPLAAAWRFRIEPGAVTAVEVGSDGRWALVRLNERADPPAG